MLHATKEVKPSRFDAIRRKKQVFKNFCQSMRNKVSWVIKKPRELVLKCLGFHIFQ